MKKGFTLVELLAILVILGLILVILIPAIFKVIDNSQKNEFINNVDAALTAAEAYISDPDVTFTLPAVSTGQLLTVATLISQHRINNATDIETGAMVVFNNGGTYEIYAFISNGKYKIVGYSIDDIEANITTDTSITNYTTLLTPISNYFIVGFQLQYS